MCLILATYFDWLYIPTIFYVILGHSTISAQCRLHLWGQIEDFSTSTIFSWVFFIPSSLGPSLFVGLYIPLLILGPLTMLYVWVVHVHYIKIIFCLVIGAPLFLWYVDSPGLNIVKSLNITLFWFPYFIVGVGMVYVTSSSFNFCKYRSFLSNLDKRVVSEIILSSLGSVLVHSFSGIMPLYLSVSFWMRYTYSNYVPLYQSSLVL